MLALGELLSIPQKVWENNEELDYISYRDENFNRDKAIALNIDIISQLKREYGDAVRCVFRTSIDYQVLDINEEIDDKKLEEFRSETEGMPFLRLDFKLNKEKLIADKLDNISNCNLFLFFFSNTLLKFLSCSLGELERSLWDLASESSCKVILFVVNHEIWLNGKYIAILGGDQIGKWRNIATKPSQEDDEKTRNMYDICQRNLHWQDQWLDYLTPLHLRIEEKFPYENDPITKVLLIHQVNLIILYTAYRTKGDRNNPILSIYSSTSQNVELTLKNPSEHQIENTVIANVDNLMKMLEWVYELKWSSDRLSFIQITVAQYLYAASPLTRYELLLYDAGSIFNQLKWNWQAFIDGKVDGYVSQVHALEDYVSNTVQRFAEQTASMIKSLSDTMLAAIGVSIGSFIVALFKDKFNQTIFTFSMLAYAVYVFIFPLLFNMIYQRKQYKMLCDNFNERKKRFEERLYSDNVDNIVGTQITKSQKEFNLWFYITALVYVLVILLFVLVAIYVPDFIPSTVSSINNNNSSMM